MSEKQLNNGYSHYFDRCSDCIYFKSYYFDEYDSDCWCSIFDGLKEDYCEKFKFKQVVRQIMTEEKKRFFESLYTIIDRKYGRKLQMYEIIDLLNKQDERINELKKENERLNNEIELLRNDYLKIPKGIRDVWKEQVIRWDWICFYMVLNIIPNTMKKKIMTRVTML